VTVSVRAWNIASCARSSARRPRSAFGPVRAALLALGVSAAALGCGGAAAQAGGMDSVGGGGRRAASLELELLDGGVRSLAAERGRVIVLHFFQTWSAQAQMDVGVLNELITRYDAHDLLVLGVTLDPNGSVLVSPWYDAVGARYEVAVAPEVTQDASLPWGKIVAVPTTVVLDRRGHMVWRHESALSPQELARVLGSLETRTRRP